MAPEFEYRGGKWQQVQWDGESPVYASEPPRFRPRKYTHVVPREGFLWKCPDCLNEVRWHPDTGHPTYEEIASTSKGEEGECCLYWSQDEENWRTQWENQVRWV